MGTSQRANGTDRQTASGWNPVEAVRDSVLLKLAMAGVLLIVLSVFMQLFVVNPENPGLAGIWKGMLPLWGTGLIITGLGSYLYVWWSRS